jgi:hypothetical protein
MPVRGGSIGCLADLVAARRIELQPRFRYELDAGLAYIPTRMHERARWWHRGLHTFGDFARLTDVISPCHDISRSGQRACRVGRTAKVSRPNSAGTGQ